MHEDEIRITTAQATRLVDTQLPALAGQPVRPLAVQGTDNWLFRLGTDHLLRFPRKPSAAGLLEREIKWLPTLPELPLEVPEPLAIGEPQEGYPLPWALFRWLPGERAEPAAIADPVRSARELAEFVLAMQDLPGLEGPIAGSQNRNRGVPLDRVNDIALAAIDELGDLFDVHPLIEAWESALDAASWPGAPVWLHGDLQPGNLLARNGRLAAVIDFGLMARGDPATDLMPAWMMFEAPERTVFLETLAPDRATIARGRGWALFAGVVELAYYRHSNRPLARMTHRAIAEVLDDPEA